VFVKLKLETKERMIEGNNNEFHGTVMVVRDGAKKNTGTNYSVSLKLFHF